VSIEGRQQFADLINRLVNETGSRRAFARKIGVTSSAVSGWQECRSIPDLENLTAIASYSGYSIQELQNMLIGKTASSQVNEITQIKNKIQTMKVGDLTDVYRLVSDRLVAIAESAGR
jgi:transcriptional regulator with XRE-family HTH domain